MVKNGFQDEIKNCSTRVVFGVKVWRNWMDAHHMAGVELVSLVREQGQVMCELVG